MEKNCSNCYWELKKAGKHCGYFAAEPIDHICKHHCFICEKCDCDEAKYIYIGVKYCTDCILKEFEVEEETTTNYYLNGEYIGRDEDMGEVVGNLYGVEEIKEEE